MNKEIIYKGKWVYNWFSNMEPLDTPFTYKGITYNTVENFYQSMKLPDTRLDLRAEIAAMSPHKAKTEIRNKSKYPWRDTWDQAFSLVIMEYGLRIKFAPGTSWYTKLKETEGEIVEWNNWGDRVWGKTLDGVGENHLGKILMKIRDGAD